MLLALHGRLLSGFGLLMIAATVVLAAAATAGISEWVDRRFHREDSTKLAGWVTFVIVFALLGWLTLRVL